jgi:pantoate--beta-alanine ligase
VVSIFVNPLQFGDPDDIERYPRPVEDDLALCAAAGVDVVFAPTVTEMYADWPQPVETTVSVSGVSAAWEGASRPGHFDGVATVVSKLFAIAGPCRAYFGEKDFQQLALVRRVVRDHGLPTEVIGCQTVRDPDGLALSSRNVRLSAEQRRAALALSRALMSGATLVAGGEDRVATVEAEMARVLAGQSEVQVDYAAVVYADDLEPAASCDTVRPLRLIVAATLGAVRLIDNLDPRAGAPALPVLHLSV